MIDLDLVKRQLVVEHDEDDLLIQGYLDAAVAHVEQHCDRAIVDSSPVEPTQMLLTNDVKQAVLMLVAHWYANREAVAAGISVAEVPLGFERLLWYRKRF